MKISSKGRYALASMILLAHNQGQDSPMTVIGISGQLDISKIYLEQVFSLLRKGGLVTSIKGSQGGYQLSRPADEISTAEILSVTETSIFEPTESTVAQSQPGIERALQDVLFIPANDAFQKFFDKTPLSVLAEEALRNTTEGGDMYCI
ncbi:MAG: Rrf2 family transcriptional regulator [Clostridium sp.]|jgi:Rrf2 family protein|nr:Rrf2 family transcriptional regulator [Clostridium sp.]